MDPVDNVPSPRRPAAVLWTGGKDSALALALVRERLDVRVLVTFVPEPSRPFLAHPLPLIEAQAAAAGLPHRAVPVAAPYEQGYERVLAGLAADGIEVVVTGDIDRVHGQDNWITQRATGLLDVELPLWGMDRAALLRRLVAERWQVVCTLAYPTCGQLELVGHTLDTALCDALIGRAADPTLEPRFDAAGENGEYHSAVLWAPGFGRRLELVAPRIETGDGFRHLVFEAVVSHPLARPIE